MNFDMPKAVFCGLALIAAAIYFGHGAKPTHAAFGSNVGRYQLVVKDGTYKRVIDTKTSEIRFLDGVWDAFPF